MRAVLWGPGGRPVEVLIDLDAQGVEKLIGHLQGMPQLMHVGVCRANFGVFEEELPMNATLNINVWSGFVLRLKNDTKLTQLRLAGFNFGDEMGRGLAEVLKVNGTLRQLTLSAEGEVNISGFSAAVWAVFAEALKVNKTLTKLRLHGLRRGFDEVPFAEALKVNATLRELQIEQGMVGGGVAFADVVRVNTTLTQLWLDGKGSGPPGCSGAGVVFGEALQVNATLKDLCVVGLNFLEDVGVVVAEALQVNTTLTQLTLGMRDLGGSGDAAAAFAEALKVNTTLTQLLLPPGDDAPIWRVRLGDDGGEEWRVRLGDDAEEALARNRGRVLSVQWMMVCEIAGKSEAGGVRAVVMAMSGARGARGFRYAIFQFLWHMPEAAMHPPSWPPPR